MIGLDTNVVVRYIMQDDARQAVLATQLVESLSAEEPGFVPLVVVVELVWVLESAFALGRPEVARALEGLLRTKELVVERSEIVWKALRMFAAGRADLADCLIHHSAAAAGCARTLTLDRAAVRDAGMELLA